MIFIDLLIEDLIRLLSKYLKIDYLGNRYLKMIRYF